MADAHKLGTLALQKAEVFQSEFGLSPAQGKSLENWVALFGSGWIEGPVNDAPLWKTDITDDGTPFEFSLSFKESGLEARVLAEPQQAPFDALSNWRAGLLVNDRLRADGRCLVRFDAIESIFAPRVPDGRFAIWHAAGTTEDGVSKVKVYVNPQIHGKADAPELTKKALETLELLSAWTFLSTRLDGAELIYLSLDLEASSFARVKVYLAYPNVDIAGIERALEGARHYVAGDAAEWVRGVTAHQGSFSERPLLVCWAFDVNGGLPRATLHVPVRSYTSNDAEALEGIERWVGTSHAELLRNALPRVAGRPLHVGRGLITYASFQYEGERVKVTLYFAPQAYTILSPRASGVLPKRFTMADVNDAIARENDVLRTHPFLQRIPNAGIDEVRELAAHLTFWILTFQDVVRLAGSLITDPKLASFAQVHMEEDDGHDVWFINDVVRLRAERDLKWAFAPDNAPVRDISYRILSEVIQAPCDHARIATTISLDVIGGTFFALIVDRIEAIGHSDGLKFFARSHLDIEASHELFDAKTSMSFEGIELTGANHALTLRTVKRIFGAMRELADHLDGRMEVARLQSAAAE